MSLVEDPTLTSLEVPLSNNTDFSAGNAPIACEYFFYEIEVGAPQFNYIRPKITIPKQQLPVTICTADTNGTICIQKLF